MLNQDVDLTQLTEQLMVERGLEPAYPKDTLRELSEMNSPASFSSDLPDFRTLPWCSIDNDDSLDLDQLTYGEKIHADQFVLWIAVADVDALVKKGSAIDRHAETNTTSVYTPTKIYAMLPEKLSTNLTSLNEKEDRLALVFKITINSAGEIQEGSINQGVVHNHAKLTYNKVGAWFEGNGAIPEKLNQVPGLEETLRIQNEIAQILRKRRFSFGALTLETLKATAKIAEDQISLEVSPHNLAQQLIEEFMIAANFTMARHCQDTKIPSLRRIVRTPQRWDRIVEIAKDFGYQLPSTPDSKALDGFLVARKKEDPVSFPDLSLSVIKLLGRGEYVVENVGDEPIGHFGLALKDYTHSTAPNRRFPDLITHRQFKNQNAYSAGELRRLADHCTQQEDAATKVERQVNKCAAAMLLSTQIGKAFKGIITGAGPKGTWVRIFDPPIEGKLIKGFEHLDVGDHVTVKLVHTDVTKGFIDFIVQ